MANVELSPEMKSAIFDSGSKIAKWFQVYIEIKLFGATIFKKSFPPDDERLSKFLTSDSVEL